MAMPRALLTAAIFLGLLGFYADIFSVLFHHYSPDLMYSRKSNRGKGSKVLRKTFPSRRSYTKVANRVASSLHSTLSYLLIWRNKFPVTTKLENNKGVAAAATSRPIPPIYSFIFFTILLFSSLSCPQVWRQCSRLQYQRSFPGA